ncbi:MAG: cytochrome c family protein [Rhodobacteraceae bacterium]|nr:cytochrome c family protein [Paracoccaceae bacterium]
MFNTMTITKVGGALCGALLVFLLLAWIGDGIYSTDTGHDTHAAAAGGNEAEAESGHDEAAEEESVDVAALVAAADPAAGEKVFAKCKACHKTEAGANATGPTMFGIVGRPIGSVDGFGYSAGMSSHGGEWTVENLNTFLTRPKAMIADTKMSYSGLKKDGDRADLIAYLATLH